MIKILHTEPFQPLGPAIPKPAPAAPKSVEIKPGIWQAPDGKLETRDKVTPLPTIPAVPNALGDGWINCGPDMPDLKKGTYEWRRRDNGKTGRPTEVDLRSLVDPRMFLNTQYRLIPTPAQQPESPVAAGSCWVEHDGVTPPADVKLLYDLQYQINGVDQHHEHQAVTRSFFIDSDGFKVLRYRISVPQ